MHVVSCGLRERSEEKGARVSGACVICDEVTWTLFLSSCLRRIAYCLRLRGPSRGEPAPNSPTSCSHSCDNGTKTGRGEGWMLEVEGGGGGVSRAGWGGGG